MQKNIFEFAINLGHTEAFGLSLIVHLYPACVCMLQVTKRSVKIKRGSKCLTSLDDASNDDRHTMTLKTKEKPCKGLVPNPVTLV